MEVVGAVASYVTLKDLEHYRDLVHQRKFHHNMVAKCGVGQRLSMIGEVK